MGLYVPVGNRDVVHTAIKIKGAWVDGAWDENYLVELIKIDKTEEVMDEIAAGKRGEDITIWKPVGTRVFTLASA